MISHDIPKTAAKGDTAFDFVSQGIEAALEQAKKAAHNNIFVVGGGSDIAQQFIRSGLLYEIPIHLVPIIFGRRDPIIREVRSDENEDCESQRNYPAILNAYDTASDRRTAAGCSDKRKNNMITDLYYSSINELSKLIREQRVSPLEVVDACLKRIEYLNPKLNAFITILTDQAREQAKLAEAEIKSGNWRGPLHGIPVGIKDFFDTAGIKTTAAVEYLKDRIPANDAAGVARLKESGAIIIGKTNMHQLGMGTTGLVSYYGPVENPWNSDHIPGGSSSGSAAAVSSGMCYATLDTDAIGSCRLPAACCGVVGFKGTYSIISSKGILEGEYADEMILWLSHPGIITRSVEDTAFVLDVLAERGKDTKKANFFGGLANEKELRIGVADNFKADQEVLAVFNSAVETIRGLGYPMSNAAAPFNFGDLSQGVGDIESARKAIAGQVFKDIDILLLPTCSTTVPLIKDATTAPQALSPENTAFANYYGLPSISVPCGFDKKGLPLGLQVVGKPWDDAAVLQLAHQYQMAAKYDRKHPIA